MSRLPLLLLPGLNNTAAVFDGLLTALGLEAEVEAIALDLPPLDRVEAIADDLLARAPERFALLGFSFGGYVALAALAAQPARIAGLCLVGSLPGADGEAQRTARAASIERARTGGYRAMVETNAGAAFHPDSLEDGELMRQRAAMIDAYGAERFIAHSAAAMARPDRTAALAQFGGPVLMVAGERDPLAPRERMAALVGEDRTRIVPRAGHLAPMERPVAVAAAMRGWIAETGVAS